MGNNVRKKIIIIIKYFSSVVNQTQKPMKKQQFSTMKTKIHT